MFGPVIIPVPNRPVPSIEFVYPLDSGEYGVCLPPRQLRVTRSRSYNMSSPSAGSVLLDIDLYNS